MKHLQNFKKPIFVIVVLVALVSTFVIASSAESIERVVPDTVIEAGTYIFNQRLTLPANEIVDESMDFESMGILFNVFSLIEEDDYLVITYGGDVTSLEIYADDWYSQDARVIRVLYDYTEKSPGFSDWFYANTEPYVETETIYGHIYSITADTIYGKSTNLNHFESMSVTLFATVASFLVLALPLIVIFWLTKFLFSLFKYF